MRTASARIPPAQSIVHDRVPAPVTAAAYRELMRNLASGVAVVTSAHDGVLHGITATAIASVCAEPATLLIAVHREARFHTHLCAARKFMINLLSQDQEHLSQRFSERGADRFAGVPYVLSEDGIPVLDGACASLSCVVVEQRDMASHTVFYGRVVDGRASRAAPLVYHQGAYHRIVRDDAQQPQPSPIATKE